MKKLLLDECLPRKFKNYFPNYECLSVPEAGLAGRSNGELLSLAEAADVQVFLTLDQGIEYQQNLSRRHIAVVVRRPASSRLADLVPHVPGVLEVLESILPGQLVRVPH